ncbi:MAG: hypothetical protein IT173_09020 [Acidobacteria bacterium]|nr:hypothetical protein [Acidobacteriota bacterium]
MNNEIPIVCTLNDAEFRERERDVLQKIKASVLATNETAGGYAFRFPSDDSAFAMLNEFIVLERRCCPFLDFKMTIPRELGEIHLELSGPDGAKAFIAANFAA